MLLKPATPEDYSERIATLIWAEDPKLMTLEFQTFEGWASVLQNEWPTSGAANSHDATYLATVNGVVCGLVNGFPASQLDARLDRSETLRGPSALSDEMAQLIDGLFAPPPADAFYILDISVHPTAQNRGVGAALIKHAQGQAKDASASAMCLNVNAENSAIGFYQHLGFEGANRSTVSALHRHGITEQVQMTRAVDQ